MNVKNNKLPFSAGAPLLFSLRYSIIFLNQQELVKCEGFTPFTRYKQGQCVEQCRGIMKWTLPVPMTSFMKNKKKKKKKKKKKSCSSITVICLEKFVIFKRDTSTLFSLPIEEKNVIQNSSLLKTIFRRCRLPSNFLARFQQNCLIIFDKLELQLFCCQLNRVKTHHKAPAGLSM